MIPQIELSYYTNSLSLLYIQHCLLKVKVTVRVTVQSTDAHRKRTTPQPQSSRRAPLDGQGEDGGGKWKRMTQPRTLVRLLLMVSCSTNLHCVLVSKLRFIFVYFILEKKDMQATTMRITNMFAMMCFAESKQGWKPSGCSILAPFLSSIWLLWTITALWGVDTFSCSSICGVVINFLTAIGVTISWDVKQPQSCNQSP